MRKKFSRGCKTATAVTDDVSAETATNITDKGIETYLKLDDTTSRDSAKDQNVVDSSKNAANLFVKLGFSFDGTSDDLTKLDCDQMMVHIEGTFATYLIVEFVNGCRRKYFKEAP